MVEVETIRWTVSKALNKAVYAKRKRSNPGSQPDKGRSKGNNGSTR